MSSLETILSGQSPASHPFLLIQSSAAQTGLPLLRQLIKASTKSPKRQVLLACFLHAPSLLVGDDLLSVLNETESVYDRVGSVPGYDDDWKDPRNRLLELVKSKDLSISLDVFIDSVDTLASDLESIPETYKFLRELSFSIASRTPPSRLVLHLLTPSSLTALLTQLSFSPSLTHLIAHPPILLTHLASSYSTPPPPFSPPHKFWAVFIPFSERAYESVRLVYGARGEGNPGGGQNRDIVVEALVRAAGGDGSGRRRAVERNLCGWSGSLAAACDLDALDSLSGIYSKKPVEEIAQDPTLNLSFNLNLTPAQQASRSQVPLPYAHEGKPQEKRDQVEIFYDPDSADDLDDDDPDEDLDI